MLTTLALLAAPAYAVDRDVPATYATIADAIAASANGDRVVVAAGTYCERVVVDVPNVVVDGAGIGATIIDVGCLGGTQTSAARLSRNGSGLANLTVLAAGEGSGVRVAADNTSLDTVRIEEGDVAVDGGGVLVSGGSVEILHSEIVGNHADDDGGGVMVDDGDSVYLYRTRFCGNSAGDNGGAIYSIGGDVIAEESTFLRNTAVDFGGAITSFDGSNRPTVDLRNTTLAFNTASNNGSALYLWGTDELLYNSIVAFNTGSDATYLPAGDGGWNLFHGNTSDGDTFGNLTTGDPLFVSNGTDCDDTDVHLQTGSPAIGNADAGEGSFDDVGAFEFIDDVDGDGETVAEGDCDDNDASINTSAAEVCNGVDDDCDGLTDDDDTDLTGAPTWYADDDSDGYGDPADSQDSCLDPGVGWVADDQDCDDGQITVNPDGTEQCNGFDDDCDGDIDADDASVTGLITVYTDVDMDGFGIGDGTDVCTAGPNEALEAGDCDDTATDVYPGAPELCDAIDHDCDGAVDNDIVDLDWYPDADGDGFAEEGSAPALSDCGDPGPGYALQATDCDDSDDTISPVAADDTCDGVDDNCDGTADDAASQNPDNELYADADLDGWGADLAALGCPEPGLSDLPGDCDDSLGEVSPDAEEVCDNGRDDDCDGDIDEGCDGTVDTGTPTVPDTADTGTTNPTTGSTTMDTDGPPEPGAVPVAAQGCACSSSSPPSLGGGLLGLLGLLGWRRLR